MKTLKNAPSYRSSLSTLALAGIIAATGALSGCGASLRATGTEISQDAPSVLARPASEVEMWTREEAPAGVVHFVDTYSDETRYVVSAQCSKEQRAMLELGARFEMISALRERAARAGVDGLMDVSCEGTETARAFSQRCTAKAFLYPRSVGRLAVGRSTAVENPERAGWDSARRTTSQLTARADDRAAND